MNQLPGLFLNDSPRGGRGVFTSRPIPAGSVIELAPVIVLSPGDRRRIHDTHLHDYYFLWDNDGAAIALGYGSLYNHSPTPNAEFTLDYEFAQIRFTALRDLAAGEEIVTDYTSGQERAELWFLPVETK